MSKGYLIPVTKQDDKKTFFTIFRKEINQLRISDRKYLINNTDFVEGQRRFWMIQSNTGLWSSLLNKYNYKERV